MAFDRTQWVTFLGLSLGILGLTIWAYLLNPWLFNRFLGSINPVLAITVISLIGLGLLRLIRSRNWLVVWLPSGLERFILIAGVAGFMAVVMIVVDSRVILREDLNILLPQSLLYYPVINYAVQILFHLLPFSVLLLVINTLSKEASFSAVLWFSILVTATLEPLLQITFFAGEYPPWLVAYIAVHVFIFNVIELFLFQRYDFISMFSFRLVYYLLWHILWGSLRLHLFF